MNFEIAIPSYRRAKKLRDQTLTFLNELNGINTEKITVFVADYEEKKEYEEVLRPGSYGKIVVGLHTLSAQRNFISSYYPEDTQILQCDDDIKRIKLINPRPLIPVIVALFNHSRALGVNLWSIYPVNNLFFCKERVIVGKIFCVGVFFGIINKRDLALPPVCTVEDKWRTLFRYKKDGNTMRYEGACPDTVYNAKGGLYDHRLLHRTQEVRSVINDYPDLCHLKTRKNGVAEVIWKPQYSRIFSLPTADESYPLQQGTMGVWEAGGEDSPASSGVSDRRDADSDREVL